MNLGKGYGVYGQSLGYGVFGQGKFGLVGTSMAADGL